MKVLSIIDSFKGTISSKRLNELVTLELEKKGHCVDSITIADGGDGFLDAICGILRNVESKKVIVNDPLFRKIESEYLVDSLNNTAYIELAKASGINLLKKDELNPFIASTYGLGELIFDAINSGIKKIIIGIGGSATNDGGSGMLEALGVKFYDENNDLINHVSNAKFKKIKRIDDSLFLERISNIEFITLSDVENPLLGKTGATYIFSPQKGAKEEALEELESNMKYYSEFKKEKRDNPGSGAAGGVGYALNEYFNATFFPGMDYLLDLIKFDELVKKYDVIITGEGKVDIQSLLGKVIFKVASRCINKRVIIVCALNELKDINLKDYNISEVYSVVSNKLKITKEDSMRNPEECFQNLLKEEVL